MDQREKRNPETDDPTEGQANSEESPPEDAAEAAEPELVEPDAEVEEVSAEQREIEALQAQLAETQARLRAVSKAYTDLQADNKIFRERIEAQAAVRQERRAFELAQVFFDPVMNLKRSILNHGDDLSQLVDGLKIVHHQFMTAMERLGMEEVPGEGSEFDPNVHEALAVTPVADPEQDGKVLMVHNSGYAVQGKVLQAAQVVIGKYQEPAGEA